MDLDFVASISYIVLFRGGKDNEKNVAPQARGSAIRGDQPIDSRHIHGLQIPMF